MSSSFIYGIHAVMRRLQQAPSECVELICMDKPNPRLSQLIDQAHSVGVMVRSVARAELTQLSGTSKHQGCLLQTLHSAPLLDFQQCLNSIEQNTLLLVLDGVQDPHNLGACLRSADACGVTAVLVPKDRAVKVNATVRKVAAGGAESVPVIEVTNIARSLKDLKQAGVWIYGTSDRAEDSLYDHDYAGPIALVMGAEGSGLRRLTMESCDHLVKLPMRGQVESLNVSVATGVCLFEMLRSRAN
ncbi:MAG: 23S rRNA (guanosine(2251)-2'-O)-methyltransferase RlmB [Gammaproteobacteria bacterium]|nr:23S rRNA (guanosine(2251)-2'-O)-methyltransferase RlmB [Gammaproteobacteria bacterium]